MNLFIVSDRTNDWLSQFFLTYIFVVSLFETTSFDLGCEGRCRDLIFHPLLKYECQILFIDSGFDRRLLTSMPLLIYVLCFTSQAQAVDLSRRLFLALSTVAVTSPYLPKIPIDLEFGEDQIATQLSNSYLLNQRSILLGTSSQTSAVHFSNLLQKQNEIALNIANKISFLSKKYHLTQENIWLNVMRAFDQEWGRIAKIESAFDPLPLEIRREFYNFCSTLSEDLSPTFIKHIWFWYDSFEFDLNYEDEHVSTFHNWLEVAAYQWQDFTFDHNYRLDENERRTLSLKAGQYDLDFAAKLDFHPARLWEEIDRRTNPWNYLPYGDNYLLSRFAPLGDSIIEDYFVGLDKVFPEAAQEMRIEFEAARKSILHPSNQFEHIGLSFTFDVKPIQFTMKGLAAFETEMQSLGIIIPSHPNLINQIDPQFRNILYQYFSAKKSWGFDMNRSVHEQLADSTATQRSIMQRPVIDAPIENKRANLLGETIHARFHLRSVVPILKSIVPKIGNLAVRTNEVNDCIQILSTSVINKEPLLLTHEVIIPAVDPIPLVEETANQLSTESKD